MKTARAVVETCFSHLGPIRRLRPVKSPASNQHFVVETQGGRYFLKVVARPDALYEGRGVQRLRDVSRAVVELGTAGLPVERIEAADDGRLVIETRGSVYRLFQFIEGRPFDGGTADIRCAAAALGMLHARGRKALGLATRRRVKAFHAPYPLRETTVDLDALQRYIEKKLDLRIGAVLREACALEASLEKSPTVLAHNDLHPGNVLYAANGAATLIDLDNLMFAPAHKCAALAVLRFAVRRPADRTAKKLRRTLKLWTNSCQKESGIALGAGLYRWMACIEFEKILRIASRVRQTGGYPGFLDNIASRHLPNLRFLMADLL